MEINATAYYWYNEGLSIAYGRERLVLIVKFKESGKFLKTKLQETIISTIEVDNQMTYGDYLEEVEEAIGNEKQTKEWAESMIRNYFREKVFSNNIETRRKNISKLVNNKESIKINVKID